MKQKSKLGYFAIVIVMCASLLLPNLRAYADHHSGNITYTNGINESQWRTKTSVFECRLVQSVPFYGEVVFRTRAGERSGFYLKSLSSRFQAGKARLVSRAPVWRQDQQDINLAMVPVKRGTRPMWLGAREAETMLSELNRGMGIAFVRKSWYQNKANPPVHLEMSSIGFQEQYEIYLNCLTSLLPANYDQLKRTALYFSPGKPVTMEEGLSSAETRKLDNILTLVKHDSKIRRFFIDGHASAPGDRAENLDLSKIRADLVTDYLISRGVPKDWIQTRWHGERYPVASNNTVSGRSKNRRVTVRIERIEEIETLPLAANNP